MSLINNLPRKISLKIQFKITLMITSVVTSAFLLSGCLAPMVVGGSAAVGTMAVREQGVTGTLGDSQISVAIESKLYGFDPDLQARVCVNVEDGEVLLTGRVQNQEWTAEAERLAWQVGGVKNVMNNIQVTEADELAVGAYAKDSWISTSIKSQLIFTEDIRSLNYNVKTVAGVVYVTGIAQNQTELDRVLDIASKTSYVTRVVNYAKVRNDAE
jgi:osmotically-inducible protein OsmY